MNDLYSELTNGTVEFVDGGQIIQHPPSVLALRAARAVKQLSEINQNNHTMLMQSQFQTDQLLQQNIQLHNTINELQRQLSTLQEVRTNTNGSNPVQHRDSDDQHSESVCESEGQTGNVGCSDAVNSEGDSNSQGSGTTEPEALGTGTN